MYELINTGGDGTLKELYVSECFYDNLSDWWISSLPVLYIKDVCIYLNILHIYVFLWHKAQVYILVYKVVFSNKVKPYQSLSFFIHCDKDVSRIVCVHKFSTMSSTYNRFNCLCMITAYVCTGLSCIPEQVTAIWQISQVLPYF